MPTLGFEGLALGQYQPVWLDFNILSGLRMECKPYRESPLALNAVCERGGSDQARTRFQSPSLMRSARGGSLNKGRSNGF